MASLPRTTDVPDSAASKPAEALPAIPANGARRRLLGALRAEPWWLRGVTTPLVGMVLALAALQNLPQMLRALLPNHSEILPWEFAVFDLASQLMVGMTILVVAAFLANLPKPRVPIPLALAIAVVVGSVIPINAMAYLARHTEGGFLFPLSIARRVAIPWAIAASAWYFLQRASARQDALRAADVARRRLETGVVEAHVQALAAQVEPHFLFNTLAHVRRLYRTDPLRARLMLDSFRDYLHSALPRMRGQAVTLGHELDLVRAYLDVQRVRMGRRLTVSFDVSARLRDCELPSMMLVSLAENAIKHGLNPVAAGGSIVISAIETGSTLEVCVADTGCGIGDMIGSGTGLANIRGRLAALYGAAARFALTPNLPTGVRATIRLPLASVRPEPARPGIRQRAEAA
jgi:sensor histidine kinase YesM